VPLLAFTCFLILLFHLYYPSPPIEAQKVFVAEKSVADHFLDFPGLNLTELLRPRKEPKWVVDNGRYRWVCTDHCGCLPPTDQGLFYIHQSYWTANRSQWRPGWSYFQRSWLRLARHSNWQYVFWTDQHNALLARCLHYEEKYESLGTPIMKADMSRLLYLFKFGGLYVDMDMIMLKDHKELVEQLYAQHSLLLQGESSHGLALEWAFARRDKHDFFKHCLDTWLKNVEGVWGALLGTGPEMLQKCFKSHFNVQEIKVMYGHEDVLVLPAQIVAPWNTDDQDFTCAKLRVHPDSWWTDRNWKNTDCYKWLGRQGSYVFTIYSGSWMSKKFRNKLFGDTAPSE